MSRAATAFRQADIARAIKGAKAAGMDVKRIEIAKDGKIVIVADDAEATTVSALDDWRRASGKG